MTDPTLPIELWPIAANTGWGLFGMGLALGLARQGRRVILPPSDPTGIPLTVKPTLGAMMQPIAPDTERIAIRPYGLHWPKYIETPHARQVLIYMAEDTAVPDHALTEIRKYELVLAPSRWAQGQIAKHDIPSTLWWQGFDESLFYPAPRKRPADGPLYVFCGGKLEFRKGQDIVVEAFKRFRETPEGKEAILVTAWHNHWVQTMASIWESGYVKGVPIVRNGVMDIPAWLEANGLPREANIDLGLISQAEMAQAIRECDVAIFPNRCECATNLVLPEAMACGVPCIVGNWAGQADVVETCGGIPLLQSTPVTLPCPIYNGYDGWGEANVQECVDKLCHFSQVREQQGPERLRATVGAYDADAARTHFGWTPRSIALTAILDEHFN